METRLLGRSGLRVSALGFGTMTFGGEGFFAGVGNTQVEEARRLIEIVIEAGPLTLLVWLFANWFYRHRQRRWRRVARRLTKAM